MAGGTITSANAVFTLSQETLFPGAPQQIQGFSADRIYDMDAVTAGEASMGVDGKLSAGFIFAAVSQNVELQADSASNRFFETIYNQEQAAQDKYPLQGIIILRSIDTKLTLTKGFLMNYPPSPPAGRTLQPRRFTLLWEKVFAAPV